VGRETGPAREHRGLVARDRPLLISGSSIRGPSVTPKV
jgi:hypothetical protein